MLPLCHQWSSQTMNQAGAWESMIQLITKAAIVVLVIGLFTTQATSQRRKKSRSRSLTESWYLFTSPDKDFTLRFPQEPKRESDEQGTITMMRMYAANTEKGMRFSINFQDLGGDPRSPQNNEWASYLEQWTTQAARNRGERVVQIHRLARNVIEMESWQTVPQTGAIQNYLNRSIIWRGRVYSLGCGSLLNNEVANKVTCRRFFNSIRFTTQR
jgi:hypothetical protein